MKEKLKELLIKADENAAGKMIMDYKDAVDDIADYLLANGVIVPPCKVGDVVYDYLHKWKKEDGITPYQITNITITQNKKGIWTKKYRAMQILDGKTIDWQINFSFDDLGKTVFLSREEAEAALKGGEG